MIECLQGNCLEILPTLSAQSVQCCVTSPPYWGLRDYGMAGQFGLDETPEEYITKMVAVFREVWRVLRLDGTFWLNMGDSYASDTKGSGGPSDKQLSNVGSRYESVKCNHGLKPKDLCGIPWRLAFALQADGWYLRSDIIWHKPNPMPESVTDRPTKSHEYIFLLTKSERYFYDTDAIREPVSMTDGAIGRRQNWDNSRQVKQASLKINGTNNGNDGFRDPNATHRNKRTVWTIATQPYAEAHFATFPEEIPKLCILAGSKPGDTILDPFAGSGTVGKVALELGRKAVLVELNPAYVEMIQDRINVTPGFF